MPIDRYRIRTDPGDARWHHPGGGWSDITSIELIRIADDNPTWRFNAGCDYEVHFFPLGHNETLNSFKSNLRRGWVHVQHGTSYVEISPDFAAHLQVWMDLLEEQEGIR